MPDSSPGSSARPGEHRNLAAALACHERFRCWQFVTVSAINRGMLDDLRMAFRSLSASKAFTLVAVTVLALGIGATTAVFSVVDAAVLRPLPYDDPGRLVAVGERNTRTLARPGADPQEVSIFSPQNYLDVAANQESFEVIAAVLSGTATIGPSVGDADPEDLRIQRVTSGFFRVFRVQPRLGRTFTADDELAGRDRVCVLSDALWRRRFAADPAVVGQTIDLNALSYTVIGVLGAGFTNPMSLQDGVDLWTPYVPAPDERVRRPESKSWTLAAVARLKPGVSLSAAQADLEHIADSMRRANPQWNKDVLVGARPLRDQLVGGRTSEWMLLLLGAVALVLAIACANVANLLLARGSRRERDMAVRAALGASRGRIARQVLVESLTLAALGTAAAMLVATWGVTVLRQVVPAEVPHVGLITLDARSFGLAVLLAVMTGLFFGLAPAVQTGRADVAQLLGNQVRGGTTSRSRACFGDGLVIVEIALAMVLLVGAALFIGSFRTVMSIDLGFVPDHVAVLSLAPGGQPPAGAPTSNFAGQVTDVIDVIRGLPGVAHAAFINGGTPIVGRGFVGMQLPGTPRFGLRHITPDYFATLAIPILRGRAFSGDDRVGATPTAILDDSAARAFFPDHDALGQTVPLDGGRRVVGIVGDIRELGPERNVASTVYVPFSQSPTPFGDFIVKTTGDPSAILPAVKLAAHAALRTNPVRSTGLITNGLERNVAARRFNMLMLGLLGSLGVLIAAIGIYGLLSYLVSQRQREIGIRLALGASREAIVRLVLERGAILVVAGLSIGGFGAWALGGTAKAFLFRMDTGDPRVYAAAFAALVVAAAGATVLPAWRAAAVDPIATLRSE